VTAAIGRCNLTRSQSDNLIVLMAVEQEYIIANWRGGEAIVHGWGATQWSARNKARQASAPLDSEMCSRVVGENMVWQGPSGRRVTIEDLLTVDD
jgi:hypothetical protein